MKSEIKDFLGSTKSVKVMVVGDLILDEYIWGTMDRISPEAPVPIVESTSENATLGGAANVANNLKSMGCDVHLFGVIGPEEKGKKIKKIFRERGIYYGGVIVDPVRKTTNKIRVIAHSQQILRLDREDRRDISSGVHEKLLSAIKAKIPTVEGIILSDYGKGVLTPELIKEVVLEANRHGKKVIADPKGTDYHKYKGVSLLTPNKKEASEAVGLALSSEGDFKKAATKIFRSFGGEALMITRGAEGISVFRKGKKPVNISTVAKEVYDVTGAGDTVISMFGMTYFAGIELIDAARLANIAAGIEVGKVGTSIVTRKEVLDYLEEGGLRKIGKVVEPANLDQVLSQARNNNKKIVFTNGCFDLLHIGHVKYLNKARSYGDMLIVGLNSDKSVRKLKGQKRPLIGEEERSSLIAALDCVDYVIIFSEETPDKLIRFIQPNILVKGGDYSIGQVVGRDIVEQNGGRVELVPVVQGMSTSGLVQKIVDKYKG